MCGGCGQAYGLVAFEAALRGVPPLTSDVSGLPEANPVKDLVVPVRLVYDLAEFRVLPDTTIEEQEQEWIRWGELSKRVIGVHSTETHSDALH